MFEKINLLLLGCLLGLTFLTDISPVTIQSTSSQIPVSDSLEQEPDPMQGITARHNYWRKQVGVAPLVWSNALAKTAQKWADQLSKENCKMRHSTMPYGENIFWANTAVTTKTVVDKWADERKDFNFQTLECNKEWYYCGHYTQVIWQGTTQVGCAKAVCSNGDEIWVCHYAPAGNVKGKKPYTKK
ncbi:MAG: CAP domain-containing protein [Thermonemataceae bacterium]